jgi:hypothetical protein
MYQKSYGNPTALYQKSYGNPTALYQKSYGIYQGVAALRRGTFSATAALRRGTFQRLLRFGGALFSDRFLFLNSEGKVPARSLDFEERGFKMPSIMEILEQSGNVTMLQYAATKNNPKLALMCIEAGDDLEATNKNKQTALEIAVYLGCREIVKMLIDAGCSLRFGSSGTWAPYSLAAKLGDPEIFKILTQEMEKRTPDTGSDDDSDDGEVDKCECAECLALNAKMDTEALGI